MDKSISQMSEIQNVNVKKQLTYSFPIHKFMKKKKCRERERDGGEMKRKTGKGWIESARGREGWESGGGKEREIKWREGTVRGGSNLEKSN